jgi:hypothetical protein
MTLTLKIYETDIKQPCESFLYSLMNMDKLIYLRLNSGDLIIGEGKAKRRVRCCPKGTSDGIVIIPKPSGHLVIFVEYKKAKGGKQTREQAAFDKKVCGMGFEYWLVSDADEFMHLIGEVIS